jgi:hypothetical protein
MKSTTITKKHVSELHSEIIQWKSQVDLERDELKIFNHALAEILSKNTESEATTDAEHFQNQFIRHGEVCDELYHELKATDDSYAHKMKGNSSSGHVLLDDQVELRDKMNTNTRLFLELKAEYLLFLEKWF